MRHLLTHGVFLVGGGCAALLAQRLFGSAWLALFALAAFTLHPRLYAHAFVNSKGLPFAAVFMVCLCLAHRAFKRDTAGAFALLGAGVGVLTNQRVMGVLRFALVAGLKLLEAALAGSWAARRRALGAMAAFAAGGLGAALDGGNREPSVGLPAHGGCGRWPLAPRLRRRVGPRRRGRPRRRRSLN